MDYLALIGSVLTLIGTIFMFLAALGLLRMPDVYNRIQAGTKASTLGSVLTLLGIGLIQPDWLLKIGLLIIFILLSNPVSSHVLGRAAHHKKLPMSAKTVVDHLTEDQTSPKN
ncbi:MAG: monovalent cation/H(+) antiporter subunit G [Bacteroidota bacterium]|nr:monovalent cation/H(+) antiporter subunit G [Bacteroidota bacterium]